MNYEFKSYIKSKLLRDHLNLGGTNPEGEAIKVTSLYLEKGDKPWIPVMGEYHFSRANSEDWYKELCKMKAGGINTVASYLFWIYHEEEEGNISFEGDLNVRGFVEAAQRAGLYVVLRVGPWAHGECRNGGFPDWILKKNFAVRDNNPEYIEYVRGWFQTISKEVSGLFYKDGGNIIAVQLENELTHRADHLLKLKELAMETGLIAPLYTVTGWNSKYGAKIPVDEVLPVFGGYPDAPWAGGTKKLPFSCNFAFHTNRNDSAIGADLIKAEQDVWQLPYEKYPYATCELGPGMACTHHRRVLISGIDAYALALVKLGAGNNLDGYYMYHGGTNKIGKLSTFNETKATGYPNDYAILNYDFETCLSQYGEARPQYRYLNMLHLFLNDFGESLATMEHVDPVVFADENNVTDLRYCLRRNDEGGFVFVNNHQRHTKLPKHENVVFDTGDVVFPSVDVESDVAFILPFNLKYKGATLKYATAQLLCKEDNTLFFAKIPGIEAKYCFDDGEVFTPSEGLYPGFEHNGVRIITVDYEEALCMRKLSGKIIVGKDCDIYEIYDYIDDKMVYACIQGGDYSYSEWTGCNFFEKTIEEDFRPAYWEMTDCEPAFDIPKMYATELNIDAETPRAITWKKLTVKPSDSFIVIDEKYDVAQIYANGELVADKFYDEADWYIPSYLCAGKECYLVMSELRDDIYVDSIWEK